MGRESKRYVRKTLLAVMNDPNASPRDRLLASARFERIKYKPRGRHVNKAGEPVQVEPQPTEPKVTPQLDGLSAEERWKALKAAGAPANERFSALMEAVGEATQQLSSRCTIVPEK